MTDLRIGDDIFNVTVEGDVTKPPLMLSHSLGTDLSMWDAQMPALLEHFRVVRYDTRGHGGSATTPAAVSIERLGRDALAILDALEIDRVHFIGLSMGGVIGQWLLLNAADRVDRVVLANTAAKLGGADGWNQRIVSMLTGETDAAATETMDRWFGADFTRAAPDRVAAIDNVLRRTDPRGYAACCAALRDVDLRQALLDQPTIVDANVLVITGTDDPVITSADTAFLVKAFAGAKHVALEARHISNIEADVAFNAAILAFLTAKPVRRKMPSAARVTNPTPTTRRPPKSRSTAARVPLKRVAAPVVPAATTTAAPKPTRRKTAARPASPPVTAAKATKTAAPKTARKTTAAPAKAASPARAGTIASKRAPSRMAVGKTSPAKTATMKIAKNKAATNKTTATKAASATARKAAAVKKVAPKTSPAKSGKASAARPVSARRKPATVAARGAVKRPIATKAAPKKTAPVKAAKAKPASAKAAAGRTAANKTSASTTRKATAAKRGVAKTPAKRAAAPKAKMTPRAKAPKTAPVAKASAGRRKPASAKPGRPAGRRKP
jgi:3-oxoadipate enol-lactonase